MTRKNERRPGVRSPVANDPPAVPHSPASLITSFPLLWIRQLASASRKICPGCLCACLALFLLGMPPAKGDLYMLLEYRGSEPLSGIGHVGHDGGTLPLASWSYADCWWADNVDSYLALYTEDDEEHETGGSYCSALVRPTSMTAGYKWGYASVKVWWSTDEDWGTLSDSKYWDAVLVGVRWVYGEGELPRDPVGTLVRATSAPSGMPMDWIEWEGKHTGVQNGGKWEFYGGGYEEFEVNGSWPVGKYEFRAKNGDGDTEQYSGTITVVGCAKIQKKDPSSMACDPSGGPTEFTAIAVPTGCTMSAIEWEFCEKKKDDWSGWMGMGEGYESFSFSASWAPGSYCFRTRNGALDEWAYSDMVTVVGVKSLWGEDELGEKYQEYRYGKDWGAFWWALPLPEKSGLTKMYWKYRFTDYLTGKQQDWVDLDSGKEQAYLDFGEVGYYELWAGNGTWDAGAQCGVELLPFVELRMAGGIETKIGNEEKVKLLLATGGNEDQNKKVQLVAFTEREELMNITQVKWEWCYSYDLESWGGWENWDDTANHTVEITTDWGAGYYYFRAANAECERQIGEDEWGKGMVGVVPARVQEVHFNGTKYWEVRSDDGKTKYEAPQWKDVDGDGKPTNSAQGEHNYAVAFTRESKPKIGAKLKIQTASSLGTIHIRATGSDGITIPETATAVSEDTAMSAPLAESSTPFGQTIKFYDGSDAAKAFQLQWEVKFGSSAWAPVGTTTHTVYVTLGDPKTSLRQETLFYLGCKNADGQIYEAITVGRIWNEFTDLKTPRVDGIRMKYWNPEQTACQSLVLMLASPDGNGTCVAWANLFQALIDVQGISGVEIVEIESLFHNDNGYSFDNLTDRGSFLVKNWTFLPNGSAPSVCAPFTHRETEANDELGVEGQGNPNPPRAFLNHYIAKFRGKFYDPSYGSGAFATPYDWEKTSLDGYEKVSDVATEKHPILVIKIENPSEIETLFKP